MKKMPKVAVAMSGGVDSGVAAALLVEQGYDVIGLHLKFWSEGYEALRPPKFDRARRARPPLFGAPTPKECSGAAAPAPAAGVVGDPDAGFLKKVENRCCDIEGLEAARKTAAKLGIPFYVKDYAEDFKKIVVDYFLTEYAAGRTPNPCVICNQFIKFGKLLEYARGLGCDYLATGHYARLRREFKVQSSKFKVGKRKEIFHLLKGVDETKDQSYFLWTLTQDKLAHILFPVGDLRKTEVQKIARVENLPVWQRPESFEVCFILDDDYRDFLRRHIPEAIKPGEVVNTKGEVIGRHFGLPLYTIGQRKGFEVKSSVPLYVIGMDVEKNRLIVGRGPESERKEFAVGSVSWIGGPHFAKASRGRGGLRCEVRVRHQGPLMPVKLRAKGEGLRAILDEAVRGITPGQSAVFYSGQEVLGGGVIE